MKNRPLRILVIGVILASVILYFSTKQLALLEAPTGVFSFSSWIQGQVLGISYENQYCRHLLTNETRKYPPIQEVAKQLDIKDSDSIFVNGIHCGEWLVALKKHFPKIKLFGVDRNPDAVTYVSKFVKGNFSTSLPYELQTLPFRDVRFDHAIVDGVLSIYSQEMQCKTIKQMIPMLKAGGSLYIGKNFESCDGNTDIEKDLQKYLHAQLLPKCYWSSHCLKGRKDIVEILYSHEKNMFPSLHKEQKSKLNKIKDKILLDFANCATSIFIYRHFVLLNPNKDLKEKVLPQSKHESDKHKHECTRSESLNSTQNKLKDKEGIKNAVEDIKAKGLGAIP